MYKIYRISDKGRGIYKRQCFENFINIFGKDIIVIADNCEDSTISFIQSFGVKDIFRTSLGNSGSLGYAFDICFSLLDGEVYLCEDDFIHTENAEMYLKEGLSIADYATLYDHLDKYMNPSQNPLVRDGGENTKVMLTEHSHWKYTNSTVQTFATNIKTLKEDWDILHRYNFRTGTPQSFATFIDLYKKGRKLVSCIPGRATTLDRFPSPFLDYKKILDCILRKDDFINKEQI